MFGYMRRGREDPFEIRIELASRRRAYRAVVGVQRPGLRRSRYIRYLAERQEVKRQDPEDTDEEKTGFSSGAVF